MNRGIIYGVAAYGIWGFFPVFWKLLVHVSPLELIYHRIIWSFLMLLAIIFFLRRWTSFREQAFTLKRIGIYTVSALLVGVNWLLYVWAVNSGHIVECSLGYFINPLVSVLLGVIFLRERLRLLQWVSIGFAFAGVLFLSVLYGSLPWIALSLAISFGLYGFIKKTAPLDSLNGLTLETGVLFLPVLVLLCVSELDGRAAFMNMGIGTDILIILTGLVTTVPLLLFSAAAQRIPLSLLGILQYMTPTIQFFLGVFIYKEAFCGMQFIGYAIIWAGLLIFMADAIASSRRPPLVVVAESE